MLVLTPEGHTIPFEARGSFVSQEDDDFICGVARDVSQRKARPEELREMASVSESGRGIRYFHAGSGRVRDDLERRGQKHERIYSSSERVGASEQAISPPPIAGTGVF